MLIYIEVFLLAAFGCFATNIDNALLVLASSKQARPGLGVTVFLAVLSSVILLGLALSLAVDLAIPRHVAWLGIVPISMGLYELTPLSGNGNQGRGTAGSVMALLLPLTANSLDTLLVQTVLFSDIANRYNLVALAGAVAAAFVMAATIRRILANPGASSRLLPLAARFRPWLLIVVGLLILLDTPYDV